MRAGACLRKLQCTAKARAPLILSPDDDLIPHRNAPALPEQITELSHSHIHTLSTAINSSDFGRLYTHTQSSTHAARQQRQQIISGLNYPPSSPPPPPRNKCAGISAAYPCDRDMRAFLAAAVAVESCRPKITPYAGPGVYVHVCVCLPACVWRRAQNASHIRRQPAVVSNN